MEQPTDDVIRNMHEVLQEGRIVGIAVGMLSVIRGTSRSQGYEHLHGLAVDAEVRVIDLAEALVAAAPCPTRIREPGSLPTAVTERRGADLKVLRQGCAKTTRYAYGHQWQDGTGAGIDAGMAARVDKARTRGGGAG